MNPFQRKLLFDLSVFSLVSLLAYRFAPNYQLTYFLGPLITLVLENAIVNVVFATKFRNFREFANLGFVVLVIASILYFVQAQTEGLTVFFIYFATSKGSDLLEKALRQP